IPHQVNLISASDGGALSPTRVHWDSVSVYKNVTRVLTVNANISPNAALGQYIIARVTAEGASANDTTLVGQIAVAPADALKISITDNKEYVLPGEDLHYVISVRNDSASSNNGNV